VAYWHATGNALLLADDLDHLGDHVDAPQRHHQSASEPPRKMYWQSLKMDSPLAEAVRVRDMLAISASLRGGASRS
jgi:hypothetical protein